MLLERDALRKAELDKMLQIGVLHCNGETAVLPSVEHALPLPLPLYPSSSVLCVKCKNALNDLSSTGIAVDGVNRQGRKLRCEAYRGLLPNDRGKKAYRSIEWLRCTMRAILLSKMSEDVALLPIKGQITRFPHYAYAWFQRQEGGQGGLYECIHLII